jgi:hypothetical protein
VAVAGLKLLAEDRDDLLIVSAAVQDAIFKVSDAVWLPNKRRFTLRLQRFVHPDETGKGAGRASHGQRVWAALAFEGVLAVQAKKVAQSRRDAFASLLSLAFEPGEAPGGKLTLSLADGGEILLQLECIDAVLVDLSPAREAVAKPDHDL